MPLTEYALVFLCLAAGGILKGATGAGAPVLAVPAMTMLFNAKFAVAVMVMPNLCTNLWQAWQYRKAILPGPFTWLFAGAGAAGVIIGTAILALLPQEALALIVAGSVYGFILFRFLRPDWRVTLEVARRVGAPVGFVAGLLQGASGISAPVSLSFLNAMKLDRAAFIATVSIFFVAISGFQVPALGALGLLTTTSFIASVSALVPLVAFMPVGSRIARRLPRESFDRVILVLLGLLATKLFVDVLL
ncbi:sulfite exporter TauE/SafE family protein [Aurantimonas sp. MSK8Z-1]|uniref:sulfite exporter TauE/SafE family protein n=1 Tax=Mangrovibrevibacter kandeliae TaxID=2968473 RepID=UPI002117A8F0|nr:sulfite exporter TauE/SafE family protein [Aurantimonas sp. MSK8Z-1]MCW4114308.1 sulfite exporter TauE/SafE family protein [Aurantimonas sp. MSK8Z-1]